MYGDRAAVRVLTTRKADRKVVPVEFTFEAIEGRSGTLGCVSA